MPLTSSAEIFGGEFFGGANGSVVWSAAEKGVPTPHRVRVVGRESKEYTHARLLPHAAALSLERLLCLCCSEQFFPQKPTLIRIERMERVLDAVKRCDSEGFQLSSVRTVLPSLFVLSFLGHRSLTHARRLLSGSPCLLLFWRGGPQNNWTLELNYC